MFGLALDSTGAEASLALWRPRSEHEQGAAIELLGQQSLPPGTGKADQLILVLDQMLETRGHRYQDIDIIAVSRGPGSFTGIRSAVALARGLSLAIGCPVLGMTSHEAVAARIGQGTSGEQSRSLMIVQDAKRGQVYGQCFTPDLVPLAEPWAKDPAEAARPLVSGAWHLAGSGAGLVMACLLEASDVVLIDDALPNAKGVALASGLQLSRGVTPIPGFDLRPLYIRAPDAIPPKPLVTPAAAGVKA